MSTAKSMATSYLNGKRNGGQQPRFNNFQSKFKSSTSNLASTSTNNVTSNGRLKSTSMTNLILGDQINHNPDSNTNKSRIQRPASRNALDCIHNGMNAKYAQVQSKVLLQNIRPTQGANTNIKKVKSNTLQASGNGYVGAARGGRHTPTSLSIGGQVKVPSDRTQLLNKLKTLQEEVDRFEEERENLRHELEREKGDKSEQIQQLKQELQDKLAEHDKQHEEYHQKLLEAYELADQNRRSADTVLNESRQRDEESRKRIEDLENQLAELKEFVSMKEEMTGKMYELKEQIREERERYEEQLKSLHQVFENEKLRMQEAEALNSKSHNSNYFKRIKPSLQSVESINRIDECRYCCSSNTVVRGEEVLHKSEHDMYGSKLSTRMHDTARSAWKASKHFANSVVTGKAVGISGCRKRGSSKTPKSVENQRVEEIMNPADAQLTSVVKVESTGCQGSFNCSPQVEQANQNQSLIRVDENNKLTIVTKFTESINDQNSSDAINLNQVANIPTPNSSAGGSERSRCESSSSGRGTSSDAGSSSSQNGDEICQQVETNNGKLVGSIGGKESPAQVANRQSSLQYELSNNNQREDHKQHRRKSSLFKASKVFGSQVSLNKWRYFFTGKESTGSAKISSQTNRSQNNSPSSLNSEQHLESSRLRCMELNKATRTTNAEVNNNNDKDHQKCTESTEAKIGEVNNPIGEEESGQKKKKKTENVGQGDVVEDREIAPRVSLIVEQQAAALAS